MSIIETELDRITEQAEAEIEKLAEAYRSEVLIPACKQVKMTYSVGNGTFAFFNYKETIVIGDEYDAKHYRKTGLIPIIKDLNQSVLNSNVMCFGFYIADVKKEDLK